MSPNKEERPCDAAPRGAEETSEHPDKTAESEANASALDDEEAFFAKSFSREQKADAAALDSAFAGGLRALFAADADAEELEEDGFEPDDLSDAERIQRDLELERREAIDATILQNDADFLFEAGEKYEPPRASSDEFAKNEPGGARSREDVEESAGRARALVRPTSVLEAMLFVGNRENKPLPIARVCELIRDLTPEEARQIVADLNARYEREGAPYRIVVENDACAMVLGAGFDDVVARFFGKTKEFKLSQTAIDALALVAYRQPISHDEALAVRPGAAPALAQLVKRDMLSIEKKTDADGKKVAYYRTTDRFLAVFHLKSLAELPTVGDIDYR